MSKIFNCFFLLFFVYGCNYNQKEASLITESLLVTYEFSQEIRRGSRADIILTNETKYCLTFPMVDGLTIYIEQNHQQIEVENLIDIIGNQNLVLPPKGEPLSSRSVALRPDVSNIVIKEPIVLVVKLRGYLCDDNTFIIEKIIPFTIIQ